MSKRACVDPSIDAQQLSTTSGTSTISDCQEPSCDRPPFEHKHSSNTRRPPTHRRISDITYNQQPKRLSSSHSAAGEHNVSFKHNPVVIIDAYEVEQNNHKDKSLFDYICCCG